MFFISLFFIISDANAQGGPGNPGNCWPPPCGDCSEGDGLKQIVLADLENISDCEEGGYGDFTSLSTDLILGNTYELTISTGYGNQYVSIWIDYNDNNVFELNELIWDNNVIAIDEEGAGEYTETHYLLIPENAIPGEHVMRFKTNRDTLSLTMI
jgi:hypothetical protein